MNLRYEKIFYDTFSVVFKGEDNTIAEFAGLQDELPKNARRVGSVAETKRITKGRPFELYIEMVKAGKAWVRSGNIYIITKEE